MQSKDPLVTIAVPIYNVEKYLNRCIESIVNQTYRNLEIILVDDGSPDGCPAICDSWAEKDNRIKVIHKENAGLGMARNTGIENASGEYMFFIDSDDYIAADTVEKCLASAKKYNSDIVMYGMNRVDSRGNILSSRIPRAEKEIYRDEEITEFVLPNMIAADPETGQNSYFNMSAAGRMFSMRLIRDNNWKFVSERTYISEDHYSLLVLYRFVKSVSVISEGLYYYRSNMMSLTHRYDLKRFDRMCFCNKSLIDLCDRYSYTNKIKECLYIQFLGDTIAAMKLLIKSGVTFHEKMKRLRDIVKNDYLQEVIRKINARGESVQRKIMIAALKAEVCFPVYVFLLLKCLSTPYN